MSVPLTHKLHVLPGHLGFIVSRYNGQGEESSYLHEEVTLISRRGCICFNTVEVGKITCGIQMFQPECLCLHPTSPPKRIHMLELACNVAVCIDGASKEVIKIKCHKNESLVQ